MRSITCCFLILLVGFTVFGQKKLLLEDKSYENEIKTISLYSTQPSNIYNYPISSVAPIDNQNLILEFDDLKGERNNYYVKLIHCNADWTKSNLMDLDFLNEFNEYPITEYDLSSNISIPYIHYYFQVPSVKVPGNYVLVVYQDYAEDILLTKRFLIYGKQVRFTGDNQLQGMMNLNTSNQQLNFRINYSGLDVINPAESFRVVIRQNQRWDNARMNIMPSFIREDKRELEYRFYDQDKQFMAGNEFRFVDFRSLNSPGQNTGRLIRSNRPFQLYVQTDKPRKDQAYAIYRDINGAYIIDNLDYREAWVSGDYLFVTFTLSSPPVNGQVHILGAFNNWTHSNESKMNYNSTKKEYEITLLLKQGFYNYQYWVDGSDSNSYQLEGSHFQTENLYEVLVYYHTYRSNSDLLVGYFPIPVNPR